MNLIFALSLSFSLFLCFSLSLSLSLSLTHTHTHTHTHAHTHTHTHTQRTLLYAPISCHFLLTIVDTLSLVALKKSSYRRYMHDNSCIFINDCHKKDLNLRSHTNHLKNNRNERKTACFVFFFLSQISKSHMSQKHVCFCFCFYS